MEKNIPIISSFVGRNPVQKAVIKPTIVKGSSMEPTFYEGDYLIVNKVSYLRHAPERGDVIVLRSEKGNSTLEGKLLIKRVCAVAGDEIRNEEYLSGDVNKDNMAKSWTVPDGCVFVMGDHRSVSLDSRSDEVGFIKNDDIVGRAILKLWPFSEISIIANPLTP